MKYDIILRKYKTVVDGQYENAGMAYETFEYVNKL